MHNIFFPIETTARELDFRLLLAARVIKDDRRVYICSHRHLEKIMHRFRGGIYVGKHIFQCLMTTETWSQYKKAKQLGIDVLYLPEEGAVYSGAQEEWKKALALQYDPKRFDRNDRLCVWGDWQKSAHDGLNLEVPIVVTGHPRFDLCKEAYRGLYKDKADQLRMTHGNFILINGNYGEANHGMGPGMIFSPKMGYDPSDAESRHTFVDYYVHSTKSMVDMISLVHRLSTAFPEKTIVYRNHPSEGDQLYRCVFTGLRNVKVIHEGAIGPWLLAAETVIHDGCTTAIEASFANTQIINYKLNKNERCDIKLPNLIGTKATSPEAVIATIKNKVPQPIDPEAFKELDSLIANFHVDAFDSLAQVIDEKIATMDSGTSAAPSLLTLKHEYLRQAVSNKAKMFKSTKRRLANQYQNKKFSGFDMSTIRDQVNKAANVMNTPATVAYADPLMLVLEKG